MLVFRPCAKGETIWRLRPCVSEIIRILIVNEWDPSNGAAGNPIHSLTLPWQLVYVPCCTTTILTLTSSAVLSDASTLWGRDCGRVRAVNKQKLKVAFALSYYSVYRRLLQAGFIEPLLCQKTTLLSMINVLTLSFCGLGSPTGAIVAGSGTGYPHASYKTFCRPMIALLTGLDLVMIFRPGGFV